MALSDQYSRDTTYYYATLELGYPAGTSSLFEIPEINTWIAEFQDIVCQELEPVWATATATVSTTTLLVSALTTATTLLRVGDVYYTPGGTNTSTWRLSPRTKQDLQLDDRAWSYSSTSLHPSTIYPIAEGTFGLYPAPLGTGTVIVEFPTYPDPTLAGTSTVQLPPWMRYGANAYVGWRFFSRFGPAQDLARAAVYKRIHEQQLDTWRTLAHSYFPEKGARIRPGANAQARVLAPRRHG